MAEDAVQPTQAMPAAGATQMGGTTACPVCRSTNSALETYCCECGFLLASAPGEDAAGTEAEGPGLELVETRGGRRFALRPGANLVGREATDVLLMDTTVSRRHASLQVEADGVTVTDLGSTNGTRIDGAPVTPNEPAPLQPGMTVSFGSATLALVESGALLPAEAPAPRPAETTVAIGDAAAQEEAPSAPPGADGAALRLVPIGGAATPVALAPGTLMVGRRPTNEVAIAGDSFVSGTHAALTTDGTGTTVVDLQSTNGTLLNKRPLKPGQPYPLAAGDELQMGQCVWRCEALEAEPTVEAVDEVSDETEQAEESAPEMPGEDER